MSTRAADVQILLEAHACNGERPGWDDRSQRLFWVDMRAPSLNVFDPATRQATSWEMPAWIGTFALCEDGRVAVALRTGLYLFTPDSGALEFVAAAPYDTRRFCFNDGRCDRQGRFLVGPMHQPLAPGDAAAQGSDHHPLWRFENGGWVEVRPPVQIANGLAFSPDGHTLYHADTPRKTIWACDYDVETGSAAHPRAFATVDLGGDDGGPDGAVVDSEGFYICAVFGGGCLLRFDPAGRLERRIELPVKYPTMPALGGPGRSTLFVTSASFPIPTGERQNHPEAGALLGLEAPAPGLPTSYMALDQIPSVQERSA